MMNFGWRSSYELSTPLGESTFPSRALSTSLVVVYISPTLYLTSFLEVVANCMVSVAF